MGLTDKKSRNLKQTVFLLVRYCARLMDAAAHGFRQHTSDQYGGVIGGKLKPAAATDTWVVWVW